MHSSTHACVVLYSEVQQTEVQTRKYYCSEVCHLVSRHGKRNHHLTISKIDQCTDDVGVRSCSYPRPTSFIVFVVCVVELFPLGVPTNIFSWLLLEATSGPPASMPGQTCMERTASIRGLVGLRWVIRAHGDHNVVPYSRESSSNDPGPGS